MKALSLFSSAGIGEYYLSDIGIDVVIANEIIASRAETHRQLYPLCRMVNEDITLQATKDLLVQLSREMDVDIVIATPPCQGVSTAGKNKSEEAIFSDPRNFLVLSALDIIDELVPSFFIIENVPRFQEMLFPYKDDLLSLEQLLTEKYSNQYELCCEVLNAADYGVPQTRYRVVYRAWKKGKKWLLPKKQEQVSLREAIGDLPTIESGCDSGIKNHYARKHPANHIECMKNTETGKSAFQNEVFYPKKTDGSRIKGYGNSYKRMRWDYPAPTITMRNEIISSQENVHPGRLLPDGTYSDARVLSLRELLIIASLPADLDRPMNISETFFRQLVGEGVPPIMLKEIMKGISD